MISGDFLPGATLTFWRRHRTMMAAKDQRDRRKAAPRETRAEERAGVGRPPQSLRFAFFQIVIGHGWYIDLVII